MAKIIVLEDDGPTRRLVCAVAQKLGHEVLDFDNGAEGLLYVMAEQPDLVISDVQMPKMNGFEVLADIRLNHETADTPVILLTALADAGHVQRGIEHGADDYITKPFEPAVLARSINAQLENAAKLRINGGRRTAPHLSQLSAMGVGMGMGLAMAPSHAELDSMPSDYQSLIQPERYEAPLSGFANTSAGELMDSLPALEAFPYLEPEVFLSQAPAAFAPAPQWPTRHIEQAWVVQMHVLGAERLQTLLPVKVWRSVLRQLFLPLCKDDALRAADYITLYESRALLYYADTHQLQRAITAARAVQAALRASVKCRRWVSEVFTGLGVPALKVGINLHVGPIEVVRKPLDFGGEHDHVQGPTTDLISRLREGEPRVMWRVLSTHQAIKASAGLYKLGAQMEVSVGTEEVTVHAVQGVHERLAEGSKLEPRHWI